MVLSEINIFETISIDNTNETSIRIFELFFELLFEFRIIEKFR